MSDPTDPIREACPCVDGEPDPCTLCGASSDGVCGIDGFIPLTQARRLVAAEREKIKDVVRMASDGATAYERERCIAIVEDVRQFGWKANTTCNEIIRRLRDV